MSFADTAGNLFFLYELRPPRAIRKLDGCMHNPLYKPVNPAVALRGEERN